MMTFEYINYFTFKILVIVLLEVNFVTYSVFHVILGQVICCFSTYFTLNFHRSTQYNRVHIVQALL